MCEENFQMKENPCAKCDAPKAIKDTMYCSFDQFHNALQDLKQSIPIVKRCVSYQCRCADLIRCYNESKSDNKKASE